MSCTSGHLNGFQHFEVKDPRLSSYDLGFKFREDPNRGTLEPYLALDVSINPHITLHYGLTRSKYRRGLKPTDTDRENLIENVGPFVPVDVLAFHAGVKLSHTDVKRPRMV